MKSKNKTLHHLGFIALAFAAIASSPLASGLDLYWNETSTTWNTSTATWNTAADNTGTTQAWTNGDSAVFSATNVTGAGPTSVTNGGVTVDNITLATGRRIQVNSNTITLADTNMAIDVQTRVSGDYDLRINSIIADSSGGASSITKSGAGILHLDGVNTFSGGIVLNQGTLAFEKAGVLGTGTVTLAGGNFVRNWSNAGGFITSNALNVTGTVTVSAIQAAQNWSLSGAITGSGNFNVANASVNGFAPSAMTIFVTGDTSAYTGTFSHTTLASGGNRLRFGSNGSASSPVQVIADASQAKFNLSGSLTGANAVDMGDGKYGTFKMGELAGTGGSVRPGWVNTGSVTTTFEVGALNTSSSYAGVIVNNANDLAALNKVGTGTLTLAGTNTYTGGTTVTNGRLLASNTTGSATGSGALTVNGVGARLGGTGIIAPTGANGINVTTGVIAPGGAVSATTGGSYSDTVGTLSFNLGNTTGTIAMGSGTGFEFGLGAAGATISTVGSSDLITLLVASANDFSFAANSINFGGTGAEGFYKLFDTSLDATTWSGLTYDGTSGEVTDGLTYTNLASGLSGQFIVGGLSSGGDAGDIYFQVIPEPGAALLGGLGILALLRRRRNR